MATFVTFMNSAFGRWLRVLIGIALIIYGLLVFGGNTGTVIAVIGLVPIALGVWGHCAFEPFVPRARMSS